MRISKISKRLFKSLFLAGFSVFGLFKFDSIVHSPNIVNSHFAQDGSYLYQAATTGNSVAAYQIYSKTNDLYWLKQAARAGHSQASWDYRNHLLSEGLSNDALVWEKRSLQLKNEQAMLWHVEQLILTRHWNEAHQAIKSIKRQLNDSSTPLDANIRHLSQLEVAVDWALSKEPVVSAKSLAEHKLKSPITSCAVPVSILTSEPKLAERTLLLIESMFEQVPQFNSTYCFGDPIVDYRLLASCGVDGVERLNCDVDELSTLLRLNGVAQNQRSIVVLDNGTENARGNIIYLNATSTAQVLIHEIGHWAGLIDEYKIRDSQQTIFCQVEGNSVSALGKNLIKAPKTMPVQDVKVFAVAARYISDKGSIFPVDTCLGTDAQAYKRYQYVSPMEYLDATPPDIFWDYYTIQ